MSKSCYVAAMSLALILPFFAACRMQHGDDVFLAASTSYDDWFDGSMDTDKIICRGELLGRQVSVTICNMTTTALMINRTSSGFRYAIKYRDSKNEVRYFESVRPIDHHMEHLEVLTEQDIPEWPLVCDCRTSTDFDLVLPDDCKQIEQVAIEIELVPVFKIRNCCKASDLQRLFLKNTFHKIVDFDNAKDREIYTRDHYTIGLNIAYMITAFAETFHLIMVTSLDPSIYEKTKIHPAKDVNEAIELAKKLTGNEHLKAYIMPYGANTCVNVKK